MGQDAILKSLVESNHFFMDTNLVTEGWLVMGFQWKQSYVSLTYVWEQK